MRKLLNIVAIFLSCLTVSFSNAMEDPKATSKKGVVNRTAAAQSNGIEINNADLEKKIDTLNFEILKKKLCPEYPKNRESYLKKLQTIASLGAYLYNLKINLPKIVKLAEERLQKQRVPFVVRAYSDAGSSLFGESQCLQDGYRFKNASGEDVYVPGGLVLVTPLGNSIIAYIAKIFSQKPEVATEPKMLHEAMTKIMQMRENAEHLKSLVSPEEMAEFYIVTDTIHGNALEQERNEEMANDYAMITRILTASINAGTYASSVKVGIADETECFQPEVDCKEAWKNWTADLRPFLKIYFPLFEHVYLGYCAALRAARFHLDDEQCNRAESESVLRELKLLQNMLQNNWSPVKRLYEKSRSLLNRELLRLKKGGNGRVYGVMCATYGKILSPIMVEGDSAAFPDFAEAPIAPVTKPCSIQGSLSKKVVKKGKKKKGNRKGGGAVRFKGYEKLPREMRMPAARIAENMVLDTKPIQPQTRKLPPFKGYYTKTLQRWHNDSQFRADKERNSIIYHTFNTIADRFIEKYGDCFKKENGKEEYECDGYIVDTQERINRSVTFQLLKQSACIFHRGIKSRGASAGVLDVFANERALEYAEGDTDPEEECCQLVNTHPLSSDHIFFDTPTYVRIPDPKNGVDIHIYKKDIELPKSDDSAGSAN